MTSSEIQPAFYQLPFNFDHRDVAMPGQCRDRGIRLNASSDSVEAGDKVLESRRRGRIFALRLESHDAADRNCGENQPLTPNDSQIPLPSASSVFSFILNGPVTRYQEESGRDKSPHSRN
jgi:hypothetical protein